MEIIDFEDIDHIDFALEKELNDSKSTHYVDGQKLYKVLHVFAKEAQEVKAQYPDLKVSQVFKQFPPVPDFLSHSIIKICTNLGYRPNFYNYSYKDEMTGDAIINCLMYMYNFAPIKHKKSIPNVESYLEKYGLDWDTLPLWEDRCSATTSGECMWLVDDGEYERLSCIEYDDKGYRKKDAKLKERDIVHFVNNQFILYRAESAFNYLTMIASNTFVRKIKEERLMVYRKYKAIQRAGIIDKVETIGNDGREHGLDFMENLRYYMKDIDAYAKVAQEEEKKLDAKEQEKKARKQAKRKSKSKDLGDFLK